MGMLKNFLKRFWIFAHLIELYDIAKSGSHVWLLHNVKQMAIELARQQQNPKRFSGQFPDCPREVELKSQPCHQRDLESIEYAYWLDQLGIDFAYHRKLWELAYVCQAVWQSGSLADNKRGLGFAVGAEDLPSYFAARGVHVHATDAPAELSMGWSNTNQYAANLEATYKPQLISRDLFEQIGRAHV